MNPLETFHNVDTDEIIVRELTDDEMASLVQQDNLQEQQTQEETPPE